MVATICAERACWRSLVRGGASLVGGKVIAAAQRRDARAGATCGRSRRQSPGFPMETFLVPVEESCGGNADL